MTQQSNVIARRVRSKAPSEKSETEIISSGKGKLSLVVRSPSLGKNRLSTSKQDSSFAQATAPVVRKSVSDQLNTSISTDTTNSSSDGASKDSPSSFPSTEVQTSSKASESEQDIESKSAGKRLVLHLPCSSNKDKNNKQRKEGNMHGRKSKSDNRKLVKSTLEKVASACPETGLRKKRSSSKRSKIKESCGDQKVAFDEQEKVFSSFYVRLSFFHGLRHLECSFFQLFVGDCWHFFSSSDMYKISTYFVQNV